ncbi:hypothetical protein AB6D00_19425 [Vibrio cyclitrophicus]
MLRSLISTLAIRGGGAFAGFAITLLMTNNLSPTSSGEVIYFITLISITGALLTFGSNASLLKIISRLDFNRWDDINNNVSPILNYIFFSWSVVLLLIYVFGYGLDYYLVWIGALLFCIIQVVSSLFQAQGKIKLSSAFQTCLYQLFFIFSLLIVFYMLEIDLISNKLLKFIFLTSLLFCSLAGLIFWFFRSGPRHRFSFKMTKEMKVSLPSVFIAMSMSQIILWGGQLVVAWLLSVDNIAFYASAQKTAALFSLILVATNFVVSPRYSKYFEEGDIRKVDALSLYSSRFILAVSFPIFILFFIFSNEIMGLFGLDFYEYGYLLKVLLIGQFINLLTGTVGYLLNMTNNEADMRNIVLIMGPLSLIFCFIMTYIWGVLGTVIASSLSMIFQNLLACYFVKLRLGFNTLNLVRKVR